MAARVQRRSAEAFSSVVKHSVPQSCFTEPKTPGGVPAAKVAERTENARGAGARSSYGWQISVGRIACLLYRSVARPGGGTRALARKKFVVPPDAGREWADGETVRVHTGSLIKFPCVRPAGFGLQVLDTIDGVLGRMPVFPLPARRSRSPQTRRSTPHHHPRGA
jgi:hypothetical protein